MKHLLLAFLFGSMNAHAGVVLHQFTEGGVGVLLLHEERGKCGEGKMLMESRKLIGNGLQFSGCWSPKVGPTIGPVVLMEWDDGDTLIAPVSVFRAGGLPRAPAL